MASIGLCVGAVADAEAVRTLASMREMAEPLIFKGDC